MFYDADAMRCRLHTEAVAQETMRLLPVAPLQGAEPIEDTLIGDVLVPKARRFIFSRDAQPKWLLLSQSRAPLTLSAG